MVGSTAEDRDLLEILCCSEAFGTLALSFPLLGHVLYMLACSTLVINVAASLMWGNSDHLSLPGLMSGTGWASCVQLLILWSSGFLFAGPCRNQVSTAPVNVVREQNPASHYCRSNTKPISSPGFSSVFCKADD